MAVDQVDTHIILEGKSQSSKCHFQCKDDSYNDSKRDQDTVWLEQGSTTAEECN